MTSDPHQKGEDANQRQHQRKGDGGVGGDRVEEQVHNGRHDGLCRNQPVSGIVKKRRDRWRSQ